MKTKASKKIVRAFSTTVKKRIVPKKLWVDKGTHFAGGLEKFCKARRPDIYSTMSDTRVAFAERTIRSKIYSLPLHGRLWVQVHLQVTTYCQNFEF